MRNPSGALEVRAELEDRTPQCMCRGGDREVVHVYHQPPRGEIAVDWKQPYRRELVRCSDDGHIVSVHELEMARLYEGAYVDATYGRDGMQRTFERVLALPPERSDNAGRVARLVDFGARWFPGRARPSLLDVGSGTGVFPFRVQEEGWSVIASDPDPRAVEHLSRVGVEAVRADFMTIELDALGTYDIVTFNKVLEHVVDPVSMLRRAKSLLATGGFVYLEVPDADGAARDPAGYDREEFFVDHHHVFTAASARLLVEAAGFAVAELEALQEPSTKYTLRVFAA